MLDQATAQAQATRLRSKARGHKRTAAAERRAARETMQQLAALVHQCRELGIDLVLEDMNPTTQPPRRQSGRFPQHPRR